MRLDDAVPFDLHTAYSAARELFLQADAIVTLAGVPHRLAAADAVRRIEALAGSFRLSKAVIMRHARELAAARQTAEPVQDAGLTAICYHGLALSHARRVLRVVADALEVPSLSPFPADRLRDRWQAVAIALLDLPETSGGVTSGLFLEVQRAVERRRELANAARLAATPDHPTQSDAPQMPEKDRTPLTPNEREAVIADFLRRNPDAQIRDVAAAVAVATGTVSKSPTWQAEMARRKANRPPRQPIVHQLRGGGEATILADHRAPVDAAVKREEDDAAWRRIVESADPQHRGVLNGMNEQARSGLIKYSLENGAEETKTMVELAAGQAADLASERRSPRRQ